MALITTSTPNLVGGVSQQPASLRLPNQAEEQENATSSIIEGLKKRNNTEHVGVLLSAPTGAAAWHTIDRDGTEKYAVAVSNNDLRVYDIASGGASKTIYDMDGNIASSGDFSYLAMTDANSIEMVTLADYTLVLNKSIQPKMDSATTTSRNPETLLFVRAGNYKSSYVVTIIKGGATTKVTYLTKDASAAANAADIQTSHIAAALHNGLTAGSVDTGTYPGLSRTGSAVSGVTAAVEGSSVWMRSTDTTDFTVKVDDSVASANLVGIKDEIQDFTTLPIVAPNDFVVRIGGSPEEGLAGYYVQFRTTSGTSTGAPGTASFEDGVWEEAVKPGLEYKLNYTTVPHALIRLSTGNFLWTTLDGGTRGGGGATSITVPKWGEREAGDDTSNSRPPWLAKSDGTDGDLVRGMGFYANRLVLLSGTEVSLSEAGQYFSWFRTTVISLLDAARISVTAAHTKVNLLNHVVPMKDQLLVFSEFSQYALRGSADGTITPTNVWITVATDYENSKTAKPQSTKRSVFAASTRGSSSLVREFFDTGGAARPQLDSTEVSIQVPSYISGEILDMAVNTIEDTLVILADPGGGAVKSTLYLYKYMINGDERVQSSWFKFILPGTTSDILTVSWIEQDLYLVVKRGSEICLEKIDFESYLTDTDSTFRMLLDRRVSSASLATPTYNSSTDQTTFVLPYTVGTGVTTQVYTRESVSTNAGEKLSLVSATGTSVIVSGNHVSTSVWIGEQYTMKYVFSKLILKSSSKTMNTYPMMEFSSYRLKYGAVTYEDTGHFTVTVTPKDQTAFTYTMTGQTLSSPKMKLGDKSVDTGTFRFPVLADHSLVTVELSNDSPFPSRFVSAEWEANYHTRNRRF